MKIAEKDIDDPSHFDNLLKQEKTVVIPRDASEDEAVIYSMPVKLDDLVCVVGLDQDHANRMWHLVKDIKGAEYATMVIPKAVVGITEWGAGYWSDVFFFSPHIFKQFGSVHESDQKFIRAIVSQEPLSKTLGLDTQLAKKPESSWKIVLAIILGLSMIMVTILLLVGGI